MHFASFMFAFYHQRLNTETAAQDKEKLECFINSVSLPKDLLTHEKKCFNDSSCFKDVRVALNIHLLSLSAKCNTKHACVLTKLIKLLK